MQLSKLFSPLTNSKSKRTPEDTTLYKVMTLTDAYCGRISYQDNAMMWLTSGGKPVKILKENIVQINII